MHRLSAVGISGFQAGEDVNSPRVPSVPRLHLPGPIAAGVLDMPADTVRHLHALRLRPGDEFHVFDGRGGEWEARLVSTAGQARAEILRHVPIERELPWAVTLAVGMPANDRMDWLMEKATEMGVAALQPLMTVRSVLRLEGERAARRVAHWQAVVVAACEQCGRNRIPEVRAVLSLQSWLATLPAFDGSEAGGRARCVLAAPREAHAAPFAVWAAQYEASLQADPLAARSILALSGPEGGLDAEEAARARAAGFAPVSLGSRVLRAETAPLAFLAAFGGLAPQD